MNPTAEESFRRRRRWVVGASALNLVVALAIAVGIHLARPALFARLDPGFPVDLLVVTNGRSSALERVRLELDGTWAHDVEALAPGIRTFDFRRLFENADGDRPPKGYVPRRLELIHIDGREVLTVASPSRGPP